MCDRLTRMLVLACVAVIGWFPGNAVAQPANCGDINNDGQITIADLSALRVPLISPACAATNCFDVNASGGFDPGDDTVLDRFLLGGGTMAQPGRDRGEQNLLFDLCTGSPPPIGCRGPGNPLSGTISANQTWPGPADGCNEFHISGFVLVRNNSTLTIRPGAVIRARAGAGTTIFVHGPASR